MATINMNKISKVHLIGIGGIGVSAVARLLLAAGKQVSGSDFSDSKVTRDLADKGVEINLGHTKNNLPEDTELVVRSIAINDDNEEIIAATERGIQVVSYPEIIGELTRDKYAICICGTHGKTTTTSLVALALTEGELDPTVVIGSNLEQFEGNAREGKSPYFVLEADEYRDAFLNYHPNIIVLTNLEYEHTDYYKDFTAYVESFRKFIKKLLGDGILIANADDPNVRKLASEFSDKVIWYSTIEQDDYWAKNIDLKEKVSFTACHKDQELGKVNLDIIGKYNVSNALAAVAVADVLETDFTSTKHALESFRGAWRRFELVGEERGVKVYDDYAHHPTEVRCTLEGVKLKYPKHRIIAVFQPHLKRRTRDFYEEFTKCFSRADEVIVLDIYEVLGREENIKIKAAQLAKDIKKVNPKTSYLESFEAVTDYLRQSAKADDIVVLMGAGTITDLGPQILEALKN